MRQVFARMNFSRFHLFRCHEIDYWIRFDIAGIHRDDVLKRVQFYMNRNHPGTQYRLTNPAYRPSYLDVRFTKEVGERA